VLLECGVVIVCLLLEIVMDTHITYDFTVSGAEESSATLGRLADVAEAAAVDLADAIDDVTAIGYRTERPIPDPEDSPAPEAVVIPSVAAV
jgi:hypothetical protein